ncbi:MAG: NHL repeat-containing protein, partial [Planctomycetota bacterium]
RTAGGTGLTDPHFHTRIRIAIADCVPGWLPFDCNGNGIDDTLDIDAGVSSDANANGIPDECEDCNGNGILDSVDIDSGASSDSNSNGIPDECEPDCNGNGLPDDLDIMLNSLDRNGDGIPDECQADRDADGVADWTNIFDDMARDIDRDGVLDETQDCDGDGIMDIDAIDHANNIWAVSSGDSKIKEYHFGSGVFRAESPQNALQDPVDVLVTLDRRVLVTDAGTSSVAEFDREGAWVRRLVAPGEGGLMYPSALAISPDGDLLVADRDGNGVLRYDAQTGAFLGVFVEEMSGGLMAPYGMTFGPNGNLYVNTDHAGVIEYDGQTGAHARQLIEHGAAGLHHGRGILFIPKPIELGRGWRLLVASGEEHNVLEFDPDTGEYIGVFNEGDFRGKLRNPWGLRLGPDGSVFVSSANVHHPLAPPGSATMGPATAGLHLTVPHIFQYDGRSGKLVRAYVQGTDSRLDHPKGFDFMPGPLDQNANGIPDSCEATCAADCDRSGSVDLLDFLCFQNAFDSGDPAADCDGDGELDFFDFLCFQRSFDEGCP